MDKICRLCSQKSTHLTSIFSFQMDRLLSDMILIICPIKIDASDELPKSICKSCLKLVLDSISLRERSVKSDLKFRSNSLAMETPEMIRINQDMDPFYSTTFFESESENEKEVEKEMDKSSRRLRKSAPEIRDFDKDNSNSDNFSESTSNYKHMTPYEPPWKKSKKYENRGGGRYKCPMCTATFTFPTNVRRHIKQVHSEDDPKPHQVRKPKSSYTTDSMCCAVCGLSFTNSSNMRRHIRNIHSESVDDTIALKYKVESINPKKKRILEEVERDFAESGDLTQKYFWQPLNKRFTKYVVVIGEDPHRTFTYRCLLCEKIGRDKTFEQSVNNESMSNYKRHLRVIHKIQTEKYKKGHRGIIDGLKIEKGKGSDDDEDAEDNLTLSTLSKSVNSGNKDKENGDEVGRDEDQGYENGFIGGSKLTKNSQKFTKKSAVPYPAMDTICRLCSNQSNILTSVFTLKNGRIIADMISIICPIRIEISDNLPKTACTSCINIIFDAVDLREKSIQTEQHLKSSQFQPTVEPVRIKVEKDPFNHELWLEDETNNYGYHEDSDESQTNDDEDMDYYPEAILDIKPEDTNRFKCPHCTLTFTYSTNVKRHIRKIHGDIQPEKPAPKFGEACCNLCGLQLAHKSNVKRHMQRYHDPSFPYACEMCTCRFKSEIRMRTHVEKQHNNSTPKIHKVESQVEDMPQNPQKHESILCDLCGKNFNNRTLLERHLTITHKTKSPAIPAENESSFMSGCYPCNLCDKTFTMRHNLNRHYKRFHSSDLRFECSQCNDRFRTEVHLSRHIIRVHENRNGIFNKIPELDVPCEAQKGEEMIEKCQYCELEFNGSKYRYERHMILMHEKELDKIYSCDICPKKFVFLKSLKYHVEVHRKRAREENFPYQCAACQRKFLSEEKYKHHITYSHAESSTCICYLCGKTLDSKKKLNYHMLRHQDIRNYQCTKCGMKFLQARHLDRHMTTHSDLRPFVCTEIGCGKAFKMSDVLKKHVRKVHHVDTTRKLGGSLGDVSDGHQEMNLNENQYF
ncbi:uncharacterized protein [Chironomus tepperi]|uniref:uncharacterized protein n=1 Tax=Chironomus tepperi TaxID=113505 RepID=UPI00391F4ABA